MQSFLLLAPFENEPTTRLFLEAAAGAGARPRLETPETASASDADGMPVLPRIGLRLFSEGLERLRALETGGAVALNSSAAIARAKTKSSLVDLAAAGVPRPRGAIVEPGEEFPEGFAPPFVVKQLRGARGEGVALVRTLEEWRRIGRESNGSLLVEEFLPPESRQEWRVVVLAGTLVAASRRHPAAGEFRSNRAQGGIETTGHPPPTVVAAALAALAVSRLGFAGIDVIECASHGAVVIDVNDSPGLVGISATLGRNVAADILERWLGTEP